MPARPVLAWPDPRLSTPAAPVGAIDDAVRALAEDLVDTLAAAPAIGLAGPHVGAMARVVALKLPEDAAARVYLDPRIVEASGETARFEEGSVSTPGLRALVERPARVRVAWRDLDGNAREESAEGFRAACLQHEIDQCDGIFWLRRLTRLRRDRALKQWEKLSRR